MDFFETVRRALLAGFGVQDKVKELVDELVQKGELNKSQGAKLVREWSEKAQKSSADINVTITDLVNSVLEKMNIPTKEELDKVNKNLKTLSSRLKKLEDKLEEKQ